MEFQILISSRVPSPAAQLLSNHYYETRQEYYRQLHVASQTKDIFGVHYLRSSGILRWTEGTIGMG